MLDRLTTTENGRTYVDASDLREFLQHMHEVDPGRFVVARGRLWYFCDNAGHWVPCDALRGEYIDGVADLYSFDVTNGLDPDADAIELN